MIARHATRHAPKATLGFSWGRFPTEDGSVITYRLYRRDHRRAVHMHVVSFFVHNDARTAAAILRRARKFIRDKVDEIDLVAMEVAK